MQRDFTAYTTFMRGVRVTKPQSSDKVDLRILRTLHVVHNGDMKLNRNKLNSTFI